MDTLHKTILIIDDDMDFHTLISRWLINSGYSVKSLFDGSIKDVYRAASQCDMVLLDIELPTVDGVEVGRKLKSNPKTMGIPVIMISGHTDGDKLFHEARANHFIQKPFSLNLLLNKVKETFSAQA
jgi:response regulator RpfG family c-di-GMP phosphodiesterase